MMPTLVLYHRRQIDKAKATTMENHKDLKDDAPFMYYKNLDERLLDLHGRVQDMRRVGKLTSQVLGRIQKYFRIKDIYHSNAIEGNALTIGETRLVVEMGMTLAGKTLRDQAEAKNLSHALDFMEAIAVSTEKPITLSDLRQIHALILKDIQDEYAGKYRDREVKIAGSEYKPPKAHWVSQEMDGLGTYIKKVTSPDSPDADLPILCAAAAHAWMAQIHPFMDGNGRTARILMNLILMRHGYPICIITRDDRLRYYDALEESQVGDLSSLIELVYENVEDSLEEWEKAAKEQREEQEWLEDLTARLEKPALSQARNEYEVWLRAMELLKSYFKQTVDNVNEMKTVGSVRLNFKDYGRLDFEKYLSLRDGGSAKRTWFFGIEFRQGGKRARYLFFFGYSDYRLSSRVPVVLILAKDIDYSYVPLKDITQSNKPDLVQVGFDMDKQAFVALTISGVQEGKVENFARKFFEQAVQRGFDA